MFDDAELLRRYADSRSEEAFTELVARNLNLVYFAALRRTNGDVHLAEDVVQHVFTALAHEAGSVACHAAPAGWLYVATRNAATNLMRAEHRRKMREKESLTMQDPLPETESALDWNQLRPHLDAIMDQLEARDRNAVLLRYVQDQPFSEIGRVFKITDDAARKRVDRALDKLRGLLASRGITSTSIAVGVVLSSQAAFAAPEGLVARISGLAVSAAPATGGQLFAFMSTTKVSIGVVVAIAFGGFLFVQQRDDVFRRRENSGVRTVIGGHSPSGLSATARIDSSGGKATSSRANIPPVTQTTVKGREPGLTAGMIPVSKWQNRGTATPLAALESYLWAVDQVDVSVTGNNIGFGEWKSKVDAFYATLSEDLRAKYDTPEKLGALVLSAAPHGPAIISFGVVSQTPDQERPSKYVILHVRTENDQGVTTEGDMRFELSPTGWRRTLPDSLIAPMYEYAKRLNP